MMKTINVSVSNEIYFKLCEIARKENKTLSETVQKILSKETGEKCVIFGKNNKNIQ